MANNFSVTRRNRNFHLGFISASIAACSVFYYTPVIAELAGWSFPTHGPGGFHDFYGLVFFAPVGYAAFIYGVTGAVLTALISGLILFPATNSLY